MPGDSSAQSPSACRIPAQVWRSEAPATVPLPAACIRTLATSVKLKRQDTHEETQPAAATSRKTKELRLRGTRSSGRSRVRTSEPNAAPVVPR